MDETASASSATASAGSAAPQKSTKLDFGPIAGISVALIGILGGLMLEGGKLRDVAQPTAALIVLGGTFGAVLVSMPVSLVMRALRRAAGLFTQNAGDSSALVTELIGYATKARKTGLVSLEQSTDNISDPFLRKALMLAIDGTDLQEMRKMLDLIITVDEHHAEGEAKVFECAGGYAPTIGIIGAVLGLIQVMKNLANIDEVGHGIAMAFVATVYGVGVANLLFLPLASRIKVRFAAEVQRKELIIEAIAGIVEGLNPKLIRMNLEAFTDGSAAKAEAKARRGAASRLDEVHSPAGAEA